MPGKVDDDNSSYQVFLRFNFGFDKAKPLKQKEVELKTKIETENSLVPTIDDVPIEATTDTDFLNEIGVETIEP